MKITFLGTRGDIEEQTRRHQKCSSLLIESKGKRLQIEFGPCYSVKDIASVNPDAILISHAHPTHSEGIIGLKTNTPVYMSQGTFNALVKRKLAGGIHIKIYKRAFNVGPFHVVPFGVMHSVRTPSNGFVITVEGRKIVYAGDLAYLPKAVLKGAWLYIGDGSYLAGKGNLKRLKNELIGHAPIKFQLKWCKDAGVKIAVFTHFGKWIKEQNLTTVFKSLSKEFGMSVHAAHDKRTFESKDTQLEHAFTKCMDCSKPPTVEVLWANGKAHAWFCDQDFIKWLKLPNNMSDNGINEGDVNTVRDIMNGIASKKWSDTTNIKAGRWCSWWNKHKKKKKLEQPAKCIKCSGPAVVEVPDEDAWYCGPCFMTYLASKYPLNVACYKWIETKKTGNVKCVVLDANDVNACGIGIQIPQGWTCLLSREVDGKKYMYVGTTQLSETEVSIGRVIQVSYEQLDYYTDPETQMKQVVLHKPKMVSLLEEQAVSCTAAEVIVGAEKRGLLVMKDAHISYLEEQAKKAGMEIILR